MQRLFFIAMIVLLNAPIRSVLAGAAESRFALVIGNAAYKAGPLATPINDAGLIAQALQETGFEVTAQQDLDDTKLRSALRDFTAKIGDAGPDVVAVVYFAGRGLQSRGENYLLPVDTDVMAAEAVPARAVRVSDQIRALAALHLKASILILDEARINPSLGSGSPSVGSFAWLEPEPNMLVAFNAAPGTVAIQGSVNVDPYTKTLAEMIRNGS